MRSKNKYILINLSDLSKVVKYNHPSLISYYFAGKRYDNFLVIKDEEKVVKIVGENLTSFDIQKQLEEA